MSAVSFDINSNALITVDLGETAQKAQEEFKKLYNLTIRSGTKGVADSTLKQAADKAKAEVDGVISMVEATIDEITQKGAQNLYNSLGLNGATMEFAKKVLNIANNSVNLTEAAVLKGLLVINNFDTTSIPMSAVSAGLQVTKSIADIFYEKYIEAYEEYIDFVIQFITDPGTAIEELKNTLNDEILTQIERLINEQCVAYLGMTLTQIKYYCRKGIGIYKQMKAAKKAAKEAAKKTEEETQTPVIADKGSKLSVSIDYQMNPDILKQNMMDWLNSQRDSIYNAFMILQIKDAVDSVKAVIKMMTDINLNTLADTINNLDDLIDMLDELGLNDDATAIDLSLIPSLNINEIYAGLNNLVSTESIHNSLSALGTGTLNSVRSSISYNVNIAGTKTYDISTDATTRTITITYYTNPTKSNIARKVNKVFTKATDASGKSLFTMSECKIIQQTAKELYLKNIDTGKGEASVTAGIYTVKIKLQMEPAKKTSSETQSSASETDSQKSNAMTVRTTTTTETQTTPEIHLSVTDETMKSADEIDKERSTTRRNTIDLLHMLFSILKTIIPILRLIGTLVSNYQINKEFVRTKSEVNINELYKQCLNKLGLNKSQKYCEQGQTGNPADYLYTVRTYQLYSFLLNDLQLITETTVTQDITTVEAGEINKWLAVNDSNAQKVNIDHASKLYIDKNAIKEQIQCIQSQTEQLSVYNIDSTLADTFVNCSSKYGNGTFDNMNNMEIVGNEIVYTDKDLPRMGSQILMAQMRGYKYNK